MANPNPTNEAFLGCVRAVALQRGDKSILLTAVAVQHVTAPLVGFRARLISTSGGIFSPLWLIEEAHGETIVDAVEKVLQGRDDKDRIAVCILDPLQGTRSRWVCLENVDSGQIHCARGKNGRMIAEEFAMI